MALTLKDVVESRLQQRASGVRRDLVETREAAQTRRERFSLEEADRRAARDTEMRSSAVRTDAVKAEASRADSARDAAAKAEASKAQDRSAQADRSSAADTRRATHTETSTKPIPAKSEAPVKPQAASDASGQTKTEDSAGMRSGGAATTDAAENEAAGATKTAAEPAAVPSSMVTAFVAAPTVPKPPSGPSSTTDESEAEDETGIEAAGDPVQGATTPDLATAAAGGKAVAPHAGFDAALADIAGGRPGDDAIQALAAPSPDPATAGVAITAPAASADAKAAATVGALAPLQAPPPTASVSVPLGAVPMTIGLRALGASNRFEIRLDPKDLGRIDVSIDIDKDKGTVGARLVVDRPETLALLQRDASTLQQALAQTGLDASAGISLSLRSDQGEGRGNGSESGGEAQARSTNTSDRTGSQAGTETAIDLAPLRTLRGLGRVDIRI